MQSALLGNIYVITKNNYQGMIWAGKKKSVGKLHLEINPVTCSLLISAILKLFQFILLLARTRLHEVYVQGRRR